MRQRVLRLGDADREVAEAVPLIGGELPVREGRVIDAIGAVDTGREGLDLLFQRSLERVEAGIALRGRGCLRHRLGELGRTTPAFGEVRAYRGPYAHRLGDLTDRGVLGREVRRHRVDRHDRLDPVRAHGLPVLSPGWRPRGGIVWG